MSQLLHKNLAWNCKKYDKNLLKAVAQHGFEFLSKMPGNEKYGFEDITAEKITAGLTDEFKRDVLGLDKEEDAENYDDQEKLVKTILQKRVEEVCQIYKEQQQQSKILMKRPKTVMTPDGITTIVGQQMQQIQQNQNNAHDGKKHFSDKSDTTEQKKVKVGKNLI